MEKKLKIFLMMIGFSFSLIFTNCVEVKKDPKKYYDTIVEHDVIYIEVFPEGWNSDQYQGNDEMEDDVGTDPGHDPGTDPGVDAEQDAGNDDSGDDPCAEGERRVNIDGETPCLPIKTAETLEYFENHKNDNEGRGLKFKVDGDVHEYFILVYKKNHFNANENRCQGDNIDFILYLTSPAAVDILCIDNNSLFLSLCKNDASVCGDNMTLFVQEGKIFLSEGVYNVEFTVKCSNPDPYYCPPEGQYLLFQEVKE